MLPAVPLHGLLILMYSDTNINSATELGIINTPIGDVDLSGSGQKIENDFMDIGAGFNYNCPFDKNRSAFA